MRCENCQAELTFSMALRQAMPHRYRCPRCNARYRVQAPRLNLILMGVIAVFIALVFQFAAGMAEHGTSFIPPFMIAAALIWFFFEFLLHRYITRSGTFMRIDTERPGPSDGAVQTGVAEHPGRDGDDA
jgi:CXXC-20-CXXC protein